MKRINLFLIALFLVFNWNLQAQNAQTVYKFKLGLDIPLAAVTIGTGSAGFFLGKNKIALTEADIKALSISDIPRFDRSAAYNWNTKIALGSDLGMYLSMATPALLMIDPKARREAKVIAPMWLEVFALNTALTNMTKELVQRTRPFAYNPNAPMSDKFSKDAKSSFFSGHTSISAASTFFTAKVYADLNPNSRWKPLVWTGAAILPAAVGAMRYGAGKHFWTDIITGYAVGTAIGILVPHLHKTVMKKP